MKIKYSCNACKAYTPCIFYYKVNSEEDMDPDPEYCPCSARGKPHWVRVIK